MHNALYSDTLRTLSPKMTTLPSFLPAPNLPLTRNWPLNNCSRRTKIAPTMLSSSAGNLLRHVRSGRAVPLNPRLLGATLPPEYKFYLDSIAKTAVVTCLEDRPFLKRHAKVVLGALQPLRTRSVVDRFVLAVPSSASVSDEIRNSFERCGGEICGHHSAVRLRELVAVCDKPHQVVTKTIHGSSLAKSESVQDGPVQTRKFGTRVSQDRSRDSREHEKADAIGPDLLAEDSSYASRTRDVARRPRTRRRRKFELRTDHLPAGDQPKAIQLLVDGLQDKRKRFQTLHGITGSGKTFMMASIVEHINRPTLILAPNKTLAAQLYNEFSRYFPKNRVEFFVSHFKFYQPEAYIPNSDKYIAKSSAVDHELDRLRHAATKSLFERSDTIVIASVSAIYGLGLPTEYLESSIDVQVGDSLDIEAFADNLRSLNYIEDQDKVQTSRGFFSRSANTVEVSPPWEREGTLYKYYFKHGIVAKLQKLDIAADSVTDLGDDLVLYPANHFVTPKHRLEAAMRRIEEETRLCVENFEKEGKLLEASRLQERTTADMDMMKKIGFCQGAENYSLYLSGRDKEEPPETLLDYMPRDGSWLLFIDESHVTVPQLGGMHAGNAARKHKLIRYGFRLPSAMENRPLNQKEFWGKTDQTIFVSATPGPFEIKKSGLDGVIEAVIRPTAVVDPTVEVVGTKGQLEHLTTALAKVAARGGRAIVTTITKKFAEDVADCLSQKPPVLGVLNRCLNVSFLHSGIDSVGRMQVLEAMRDDGSKKADECSASEGKNKLDVIVGVNLLREGIDLPAVQLVAILDADSEGFLRGETALIQTIGRAARNINGHVIMYADTVTSAMQRAIDETNRRRRLQIAYNKTFNIEPTPVGYTDSVSLQENAESLLNRIRRLKLQAGETLDARRLRPSATSLLDFPAQSSVSELSDEERSDRATLRRKMLEAANSQDFESAALLRDQLLRLEGRP